MGALITTAHPVFDVRDVQVIAGAIAKGGLFGANDPNAVLTLCLVAQAEGKHPATAFQQYHLINGKPAKKADAMLQDFLAAQGKVEWHALTDDLADATFSHPAGGSVRITWDNARVQQAGLGGNPMHKKYPRAMKRARCVSEGVRTVFPGATSGMYVPEELDDVQAPRNITPQREPETPAIEAPKVDAAQEWLSGHIERIQNAQDMEALDRVFYNDGKALTKLRQNRPDLHDQALEAGQLRADELRLEEVEA